MQPQELVQNIATSEKAKSHLIKVLDAFQNMDYHKLNDLLDEEAYYEDMKKTAFIYKQMQVFKELKSKGDTKLNLSTNICTACLCSEPVIVFTGNTSGHKCARKSNLHKVKLQIFSDALSGPIAIIVYLLFSIIICKFFFIIYLNFIYLNLPNYN
jgi:hypothetical protein